MFKRVLIAIVAFLIGLSLAQALIPTVDQSSNPSIQFVEEVLTPEPAAAAVGNVYIYNGTSRSVKIACNYGGAYKWLGVGRNSMQPGMCTADGADTDQIQPQGTIYMHFAGPVKADGCYKVTSTRRSKIPDLSVVYLRNYSAGCGNKSYKGSWNYF